MATTHKASEVPGTAELSACATRFLNRCWDTLQRWREDEALRAIKRRLSDREREDIGLGGRIEPDPERVRQWVRLKCY